jgi:Asp-tRNA(Asn)/Glu-tRNA(Gln) amidotransferase A subunit family amidase
MNLPMGRNPEGLPLGLQVVAAPDEDESLLEWARELEPVLQSGD